MDEIIPIEKIENKIYLIRGQKVILDSELARLYEIENKQLKRSVKRNLSRFPKDFMFQLTKEEYSSLRCQIGTLEKGQYSKYLPYAFTEQGVAMLSSVLRSKRAIEVNIVIMRTFVRLRQILSSHKEILQKLDDLQRQTGKNTADIKLVFSAIREMLDVPTKPDKKIGFYQK